MDDIKKKKAWFLFLCAVINDSKNKLKFVDYVSDNDLLAKNNVCTMTPAQQIALPEITFLLFFYLFFLF